MIKMLTKKIVIIGYSGHAFVVCDICHSMNRQIIGYCEAEQKAFNPYNLLFLGSELSLKGLAKLQMNDYHIAIGNNVIRAKIQTNLIENNIQHKAISIVHNSSVISPLAKLKDGIMVAQNATINALAEIGEGVICNTSSIIEHEVEIGRYSFVGPNATLLGNVKVGAFSFIGANSVIKEGVNIGNNVTIGAGTVVIRDVPDNVTVVGNPQRIIYPQV